MEFNPRAYRIGKLGICSDVTSCGSDLFECLDREYLIPDADNEDYYAAECEKWAERVVSWSALADRKREPQSIIFLRLAGAFYYRGGFWPNHCTRRIQEKPTQSMHLLSA